MSRVNIAGILSIFCRLFYLRLVRSFMNLLILLIRLLTGGAGSWGNLLILQRV
jgi:hypothetical protein